MNSKGAFSGITPRRNVDSGALHGSALQNFEDAVASACAGPDINRVFTGHLLRFNAASPAGASSSGPTIVTSSARALRRRAEEQEALLCAAELALAFQTACTYRRWYTGWRQRGVGVSDLLDLTWSWCQRACVTNTSRSHKVAARGRLHTRCAQADINAVKVSQGTEREAGDVSGKR